MTITNDNIETGAGRIWLEESHGHSWEIHLQDDGCHIQYADFGDGLEARIIEREDGRSETGQSYLLDICDDGDPRPAPILFASQDQARQHAANVAARELA